MSRYAAEGWISNGLKLSADELAPDEEAPINQIGASFFFFRCQKDDDACVYESKAKEIEMKKNRSPQLFTYAISLILVLTVFLSGCGAWVEPGPPDEVLHENRIWTTVGSAGTVDESDINKLYFEHSAAQMGQPIDGNDSVALVVAQTESAVIRYNVAPADALFEYRSPCKDGKDTTGFGCPGIGLEVRYLATGLDAQVVARLMEVNMATGAAVERLTFSSHDFPSSDEYQVQRVNQCTPPPSWRFDFRHKAYYIEVTLTSSALVAGSVAGVQMIKITNDCPEPTE